jgi:asparagine synthetase B (glutamine-hydrolysing)
MKQLAAFIYRNPQEKIQGSTTLTWNNSEAILGLQQRWTYQKDNVFLSIIGDQEINGDLYQSEDLILVCNTDLLGSGDCADFAEARENPAGYLAKRYAQYGNAFVKDLHGWFGIILYDIRENSLKAAIDHFGVRRLVHTSAPDSLAVASDLRLLKLFLQDEPEIDPLAVAEYVQYSCIPAPRTIYKGINKLEPAHLLDSQIPATALSPIGTCSIKEGSHKA